jgi:predicted cupin superfamily sugar epimerase
MYTAEYFISNLKLEEHVEGGYFKETYRNPLSLDCEDLLVKSDGETINKGEFEGARHDEERLDTIRALSTTIYYLLKSGQVSKFHKLKFDETWFYHYGSPLAIHMIDENGVLKTHKLGLDIANGETPQVIVPANVIFGAEVIDDNSFSLVSCVVSPGFDYRDFSMYSEQELVGMFPQYKEIISRINGK